MGEIRVRTADPADLVGVLRVLEGALLDVDADSIRKRLGDDAVFVAETREGLIVGALVLGDAPDRPEAAGELGDSDGSAPDRSGFRGRPDGGAHVDAIAVRRSRRRSGVGAALVEAASDRAGALTADFHERVRGFYVSLGFAVERRDGRLWGRLG